jgi:hypothetical protein
LKSPVVIVVGRVVDIRARLDWFAPMNKSMEETRLLREAGFISI